MSHRPPSHEAPSEIMEIVYTLAPDWHGDLDSLFEAAWLIAER